MAPHFGRRAIPVNAIDAISIAGRRQVLLHLPEDLYQRLKSKAEREKRKISAQAELYLETMLALDPTKEFELIQRVQGA
ncbi:MAG TPA: hypothetical protein VIZ68_06445 [Thermoplasmata archaeon]